MRIMAVDAEKVSSFTASKVTLPLSMNAYLPVFKDITVAFPAKKVASIKIDELSVVEP